eukprot:2828385-Prymnesium_polylepis.1
MARLFVRRESWHMVSWRGRGLHHVTHQIGAPMSLPRGALESRLCTNHYGYNGLWRRPGRLQRAPAPLRSFT